MALAQAKYAKASLAASDSNDPPVATLLSNSSNKGRSSKLMAIFANFVVIQIWVFAPMVTSKEKAAPPAEAFNTPPVTILNWEIVAIGFALRCFGFDLTVFVT